MNAAHRHLENNYALHDTPFFSKMLSPVHLADLKHCCSQGNECSYSVLLRNQISERQSPGLVKAGVLTFQVVAMALSGSAKVYFFKASRSSTIKLFNIKSSIL